MEFPLSISVGEYQISAHIILETLAFIIGYRYYVYLRSRTKDRITDEGRVWIFIGAAAGAFVFSRLTGALESPALFFSSAHPFLHFFSSKSIVGGLLGGLVGVEVMKKLIGVNTSSGDLFTYPLILGMIIGRIGCFTSGIAEPTFGNETSLVTGMDLGDGLLRHPVSLYEIAWLIVLWVALSIAAKKWQLRNGWIFQYFMIGYLFFRFMLDFIKPTNQLLLNLSFIQLMCIAGLLYYRKTIFSLIFNPPQLRIHAK